MNGFDNVTMAVNNAATRYASGCEDKIVRRALEMAFIAGATKMVDLISAAAKKPRNAKLETEERTKHE